jgi:3-phosphoshikimate 1-carboxyvinyltransferase
MISISHPNKIINATIKLPASKSISNRVLVIHFLMNKSFKIENLSNCNDTVDLINALDQIEKKSINDLENKVTVDVGEAGTSYRFLTALLATMPGDYELRGSGKLMQRPMGALIEALQQLGAQISTYNNTGHGPLFITGKTLQGGSIAIDASTSSQFITALMLVAPYFKEGLSLELKGKIVSLTYIKMTIALMRLFGAEVELNHNIINILPKPYCATFEIYTIESDWTAASYWYAFAALSKECHIVLKGLNEQSLQGDRILAHLFNIYGIQSQFNTHGVTLSKLKGSGFIHIFDFVDNPDLVQTFAFLNAALGLPLQVNNASNLVHKETDRITALANEVKKIGGLLTVISDDEFNIENNYPHLIENSIFKTYQDHRMAMAESILAVVFDRIIIENEHVVSKSYPDFWKHLSDAGFEINLS